MVLYGYSDVVLYLQHVARATTRWRPGRQAADTSYGVWCTCFACFVCVCLGGISKKYVKCTFMYVHMYASEQSEEVWYSGELNNRRALC